MADANRTMPKAALSIGLFVGLAAVCAVAFAGAVRVQSLPFPDEWQLINTQVKVSEPEQAPLARMLASEPLNQGLFNLYYSTEVHQGVDDTRRGELVELLKALGWRNTSAQRNLIFEAVRTDDLELALLRADSLLRRDKLTEFLLPVMRRMEMDEEASRLLIARLGRKPNWRDAYFGNVESLAEPEAREYRERLFDRMIAVGQIPAREELKRSLDAFVRWGEPARAAAVVSRLAGPTRRGLLNRDPDFAQAARLMGDDRQMPLPTEWEPGGARGVDSSFGDDGAGGVLVVHWSGFGSPTLAQQIVAAAGASSLRLQAKLADKPSFDALDKVGFRWACGPRQSVPFDIVRRDAARLQATLAMPGAPACDFGYLQIVGLPQTADQPVDVSFRSVSIFPGHP